MGQHNCFHPFIINNHTLFLSSKSSMISKGSYHTEDCNDTEDSENYTENSNDTENTPLTYRNIQCSA